MKTTRVSLKAMKELSGSLNAVMMKFLKAKKNLWICDIQEGLKIFQPAVFWNQRVFEEVVLITHEMRGTRVYSFNGSFHGSIYLKHLVENKKPSLESKPAILHSLSMIKKKDN